MRIENMPSIPDADRHNKETTLRFNIRGCAQRRSSQLIEERH